MNLIDDQICMPGLFYQHYLLYRLRIWLAGIKGLKTDQSNDTPVPLFRVVSWTEMILGRDDPKFGARILKFFFRMGDIIS